MTYMFVDIEADGPCPGLYSMTELGAVAIVKDGFQTFYANMKPIAPDYSVEALASIGKSREETEQFGDPMRAMWRFKHFVDQFEKPFFISDNNGFDWQFVNYYFFKFVGCNPFGHSSTNLGSLFKGMEKSMFVNFKHLRKTAHTHNPVDDAMGNAEAFKAMIDMGLKVNK